MKVFIQIFCIILALICIGFSYNYSQKSYQDREALNKERYTRLTLEEDLQTAENKIQSLNSQVSIIKKKNKSLENVLTQKDVLLDQLKNKVKITEEKKADLQQEIEQLSDMITKYNVVPSTQGL